jgi:membrane glycosyltransferase
MTETVFFLLLSPVMWLAHTVFLARLLSGRSVGWGAQARDDHEVPWLLAWRQLWPHTALGLATILTLSVTVPAAIPYALFIAAGPLFSVPLAVVTAAPGTGRRFTRVGLCRLPEETSPPAEMAAIGLAALDPRALGGRAL